MATYKLKELGNFKNGANYPKGSYGEGIKIVNVKDLFTVRYVDLSELVELKPNTLKKEQEYLVEENDILFSRSSLVQSGAGMCALAHNISEKILFCGFIIRFRIIRTDIVNPLYLLYLLRTPAYRKLFTGTQQTNIANINQETLGDIEVDLPPLEIQNQIAQAVDYVDTKIANNNTINSELEAMAKTIYDYWFLQFDFPDENGKPYKSSGGKMVYNEELKREIPEGWKVHKLANLCSLSNGINYEKNEVGDKKYKIINVRNITASSLLLNECEFDSINLKSSQADKFLVKSEDILIARSGTPGSVRLLLGDSDKIIYCGFIIKCTPSTVQHRLLLTYELKKFEGSSATKTGGSILQNVSQETLSRVLISLPPDKVIEQFNTTILPILAGMQQKIEENQELASLRDFLLPPLMNGQVGFKDSPTHE